MYVAADQLRRDSPLLALSGHFWTVRRVSAFVGKADISDACSNVC